MDDYYVLAIISYDRTSVCKFVLAFVVSKRKQL